MAVAKQSVGLLVCCSIVLLFLPSCKEDAPVAPPTRTEILTNNLWKLQQALASGSGTDMTSEFPIKRVTFKGDGTFDYGWGSGTWSFTNNESRIVLVDPGSGMQADCEVLELSSSVLRISCAVLGAGSVKFTPGQQEFASREAVFDTLWHEFDARYSFFVTKGINWDSLRTVYRPQALSATTDAEFFGILSSMLAPLKDGHVRLVSSAGTYVYTDWYSRYPMNYLGSAAIGKYLSRDYGLTAGGMMRYGRIADTLGYLYVGPNFTGVSAVWSSAMNAVMDSLRNVKGFVVDARNNGGGNESLAREVAGRFTNQSLVYGYVRWRNGPNHTDFTDPAPQSLVPSGERQFTGAVTLLTNRHCFSSGEGFILMMRVLPNVTVVGDTSGGGSANPIVLELPNGWQYWVSRWIHYTAEQTIFEGIGLAPDIAVQISPADSVAGHDTILEKAVQILAK